MTALTANEPLDDAKEQAEYIPSDPNLPLNGAPPSAEGFYRQDELRVAKNSKRLQWLYGKCFRKRFLAYRLMNKAIWSEGGPDFSFTAREILRIRHGVRVGAYSYGPIMRPYYTPRYVSVGRYCSIGPDLHFYRGNHPIDTLSSHPIFYSDHLGYAKRSMVSWLDLEIGCDVWIGARVTVLPGCQRIGHGAVVAAGAVLTKDVDDFAVVGGVPAKTLKYRFPEDLREAILANPWWVKHVDEVAAHMDAMQTPLLELGMAHPLVQAQANGTQAS